jgi:polysaccharide transporter, PST family
VINKIKKLANTDGKKRLISNFFSLFVLRGGQFLIPIFTLPYLVRTVGMENFGLVNFALSLGLYFGGFIQFGFGITATREIARHRDDPVRLAEIYSTTLTASILLAFVGAALFVLVVLMFDRFNSHLNLYIFTFAFIVFQSLLPIWFFQGVERMKYIAFLSFGTSALYLFGLFTFVKQKDDFILIPLINTVAAFFTFIVAIYFIKKHFKINFMRPTVTQIKEIYKSGRHAFVSQLSPNLYNNSSVFLLGLFTNNNTVGLYAAAVKVVDATISFAHILSKTFFPYLSRNLEKHKVFQKIMMASGLILSIAIFLMAKWLATFLFGEDNSEVATYIQGLAICIFLVFISATYGTNFLMLIGKDKVVKNIVLYTSLFFFGIALLTIPFWGIWGAIIVLVGARLTMAIIQFIFYLKYQKLVRVA